jgi:hypothetical protein
MEYVILVVGLAAVSAVWDLGRRAVQQYASKRDEGGAIHTLASRITSLERNQADQNELSVKTRNHLAELKTFVGNAQRKR